MKGDQIDGWRSLPKRENPADRGCACHACRRLRGDPLTVPIGLEPRSGVECRLCTARVPLVDGVCEGCRNLCASLHDLQVAGILEAERHRQRPPAWLSWLLLVVGVVVVLAALWGWWLLVWAAEGL